jgi:hypothetical protein
MSNYDKEFWGEPLDIDNLINKAQQLCEKANNNKLVVTKFESGDFKCYGVQVDKSTTLVAAAKREEDAQLFAQSCSLILELCDAIEMERVENMDKERYCEELYHRARSAEKELLSIKSNNNSIFS